MLHDVILDQSINIYEDCHTFCSRAVVGQCVLTIPSIIADSWFTGGQ